MASKYTIILSDDALADIDGLFRYISVELSAPQAAQNLMAKIKSKIKTLQTQPFANPRCVESPLYELGYRKVTIKNYIVVYDVKEEEKTVEVLNVFYSRRDYAKYFNGDNDGE
ncbi:MAG: type II toxin-antitoxin system RelE/ParE family toxin [Oscillospiraceae bacterium]|nr:type II toxin-antitoxin system RelE/ParE family toxin [Oscillospiraceae bacterium]